MKKFAFLPGALMAIAGVVWAALTLAWNPASITLAIGGGLALLIGALVNWKDISDWFRDPRGVFAVNTAFSTLLLVAILGVVNASVALKPVKFDMTASGRNTLAPETKRILERLSTDVTLKQFGRTPDPKVDDLLAVFARTSPRITTRFVDAEKALQQARQYGVLRNATVVVEYGAKFRKIEQVTETALATAILQVTSTVEVQVCFAQGDGERGLTDDGSTGVSQFAAALAASNYRTADVSLLQQDVPGRCNVLVVAGVNAGFGDTRMARVNRYLLTGGRLLLLVDPPVDPLLDGWLRQFGIAPGSGMVIDNSPSGRSVGSGPEMPLGVSYTSHPITRGFNVATIYDRAVPLNEARQQIGVPSPIVATGMEAFERVDPASQATTPREGRDRPGRQTLAVAVRIPRGSMDAKAPEPRLVVFGDSDWVTNAMIGRQGNRDLSLRAAAWLAGEEEAQIVASGDRENRRIAMTERTRMAMYLVNLLLLPAIPLIAGIVRLLRARK